MSSAVEREIRALILEQGQIAFAQFMQVCLYSPNGGFYSDRRDRISDNFGTSPSSHPVFGALIARQLEQMWSLMEEPSVFHVVEVGSGDSVMAQSIVAACRRTTSGFADAIRYVAVDYRPGWFQLFDNIFDWPKQNEKWEPNGHASAQSGIQIIKGEGLAAFRDIQGCILCNELVDNLPVHRFAILDGRVREIFVTLKGENLCEVLHEPSTPRIEQRLTGLGLSLPEGFRGEVNLAMEDWVGQLSAALRRGFVLTIDYGQLADDLYSPQNAEGTIICPTGHDVSRDPYRSLGQQDITCQVDFTSLMRLGQQHGLGTVGYTQQSQFLENLDLSEYLQDLEKQDMSAARKELNRIAMLSLVDVEDYGSMSVLAQAKGMSPRVELMGFARG